MQTANQDLDALEQVSSAANRIRPDNSAQTDIKNMIAATAKGAIGQLRLAEVQSRANQISRLFRIAEKQSQGKAALQSLAFSPTASNNSNSAGMGDEGSNWLEIAKSQYVQIQSMSQQTIQDLMNSVEELQNNHDDAREKAAILHNEAESLFEKAEQQGVIQGHKAFKDGVKTVRKSQQIDLQASTFNLQKIRIANPTLQNQKAELDATTEILREIENTKKLLENQIATSIDNAALIQKGADQLDIQAANTLSSALELSNTLIQDWQDANGQMQEAMQKSGRAASASKEMQASSNMWKFEMELSLGIAEEARKRFLTDQLKAIQSMILNGIAATSTEWQKLASTTNESIEHAKNAAIASYENAKLLTSNAGAQHSNMLKAQLDQRISSLHGAPATNLNSPVAMSTPTSNVGFATPQELINSYNSVPNLGSRKLLETPIDLNNYFIAKDAEAQKILDFQDSLYSSTTNLLIAVNNNMEEAELEKMMNQISSNNAVLEQLNMNTLNQTHASEATISDSNGSIKTLTNTANGWKILINSTDDESALVLMMMDMLSPMITVMQDAVSQIEDGSITSFEELEAALNSGAPSFGGPSF